MLKKNLARSSKGAFQVLHNSVVFLLLIWGGAAYADLHSAEKAVRTRNYELAFSLYRDAAQAGDSEAQYQLANLYKLGRGVARSETQALQWLQKSAAAGNPAAQYSISLHQMETNKNNKKIIQEAIKTMQTSADNGYAPAQVYLNRLSEKPATAMQESSDDVDLWFGFARKDSVSDLNRLHNFGVSIDQTDKDGRTALFSALEFNSKRAFDWLLTQNAKPDHRDKFGFSPVFLAATKGNSAALQKLFGVGADPAQTLVNGDNLLHYSIRHKEGILVALLLKYGVPINQLNSDGWTPLDMAEYTGDKSLISILKAKGAKSGTAWVNSNSSQQNRAVANNLIGSSATSPVSVIEIAKVVISGDVFLAQELFGKRPEFLKERLDDGSTLLGLAVKAGKPEMVSVVLKAGAQINQVSNLGETPLHLAAAGDSVEVLRLILNAGSDPGLKDQHGEDAVIWAIKRGSVGVAKLITNHIIKDEKINKKNIPIDDYILQSAKANKPYLIATLASFAREAAVDEQGRNALWYAARNKDARLTAELLAIGVLPQVDKQGITPFYNAIEVNCLPCAEALLAFSDINQQTVTGTSALMLSAQAGNLESTQWLLAHKADTELRNEQGNTAIINAVQSDSVEVVRLLMNAGANISRKNKLGFSALDISEKQNAEIYKLLKSKSVLGIFN